MFSAPPEITADVFARVPDSLRRAGVRPAWKRGEELIDCFLEGPCFDHLGNLHVVDIPYGRILRIDPQGRFFVVFEYDGYPNGLKLLRDGTMLVTDQRLGLLAIDSVSGRIDLLVDNVHGSPLKGLNDLAVSSGGDIYFTDQGGSGLQAPDGRLLCLRASGELEVLLDNIPSPNGVALDEAGRMIFVAVTRGNCIWRIPMPKAGEKPERVGLFIQLSGSRTGGPDGIALVRSGALAIAHVGLGTVWIFTPEGEPSLRIRAPQALRTTNLAFGGADLRTLYITEATTGTILSVRLETPGHKLPMGPEVRPPSLSAPFPHSRRPL